MQKFKFIILLIIIAFSSCKSDNYKINESQKIKIAISKASGSESYEQYAKWLMLADSSITIIDLYNQPIDSIHKILEQCDALLLSGGEDVNPDYYGQKSRVNECGSIDFRRDTMEYAALQFAFNNKMPVLGICRGQQMINVYLGGNLFIDIPTDRPSIVSHRCGRADTCMHNITITDNTIFAQISGIKTATVNSSHHQAIDIPALNIQPLAIADDGIIESIGWIDTNNRSFLLGVQYHPEYLESSNPASGNIAKRFINEAIKYNQKKESK
jgi:putative glutamine amidotransferase